MKNKPLIITSILFIIWLFNCIDIISEKHIRPVDALRIFAGGMLFGVLLTQIMLMLNKPSIEKV